MKSKHPQYDTWINKIENYCAYQERCSNDVLKKLHLLSVPIEYQEAILSQMIELGYIDDLRYAQMYVQSKVNVKKDGMLKIKYALLKKNISQSNIASAIELIEQDTYTHNLKHIMAKKTKDLAGKNTNSKLKEKLIRYLMGKGYKYEEFKPFLN